MANVEWIKITTDMFDNRKIKHVRKLPEGNNIVLIWVMLLTIAGRCNAGGAIYLTENIPYTPKMLADELGFKEIIINLALDILEQLNMIRRDGYLYIEGWEEYQNVDAMDRVREQTRKRVSKYRERKNVTGCNVTERYNVTLRNATDIEEERDIEKEIKEKQGKEKAEQESENDLGRVMSFYMDKINPTPSRICIDSLKQFTVALGADVVIHAFGIALDERKTSWSYIQAILARYERDGLKTLDAVVRAEQEHRERGKDRGNERRSGVSEGGAKTEYIIHYDNDD